MTRSARSFMSLLAVILLALLPSVSAMAQGTAGRSSYITPFPQNDVYNLAVVGDSLAEGLIYGLRDEMRSEARVNVAPAVESLPRVTLNSFDSKLKRARAKLAGDKTHIGVVMLGAQDRRRIRGSDGRRHWIGSDKWAEEYSSRVDLAMKELKSAGVAVYWIGLPNMRSQDADSAAQIINEIIRERAYLNGVKFVDIYASFADEQGNYSAFGPDLTGNEKRLRWRDGIHFTGSGYAKVAHFVVREIRRDLAQAKAERTVPLAGNEQQQSAIRASLEKNKDAVDAVSGWEASVDEAKQKVAARQEPQTYFLSGAGGEQEEDHGRINLKAVGANGREQIVSLEILRPAIPASVVALVTRKQSRSRASKIGDTLIDETMNGINIMSTVTPARETVITGRRSKLSLAQTPFFRVLVKGERLPPKSGRADSFSWPPPPLPELPAEEPPTAEIDYDADTGGGIPLPWPSPFRPRA